MEKWRALLAEGDPLLRQAIVDDLTKIGKVRLIAKVENGWDVMFTASQLKPDIILMDFNLPGLSGLEATRLIRRGLPQIQVIMLLDEEREEEVQAAAQSGACAHLIKNELAQRLPPLLDKLEQNEKENRYSNQIINLGS